MWKRSASIVFIVVAVGACRDAFDTTPTSPNAAVTLQSGPVVELQFSEDLRARVNAQGRLQSEVGADITSIQGVLDAMGVVQIEPVFTIPPDRLQALYSDARRLSPGEKIADLMSWYRIKLPAGADISAAISQLMLRPEIAYAYRAPTLDVPPPVTPDFTPNQNNYFGAAPSGTEDVFARGLAGGRGAGVTLIDLEYDWNFDHEDLLLPPSTLVLGERFTGFGNDHGTAVLGELVGRDNGIGITGGVPEVTIRVGGVHFGGVRDVANAVGLASAQMSPGDVMLIEQQEDMDGNPSTGDFVPVEWIQAVFTAINNASQAGRIVMEPAGNGGFNLDDPMFQGKFDRTQRDSRAIFVGAGNDNNARTCCNFGSRLDVQGHGTGITTTGYGDLWGPAQGVPANQYYTATFGGTSGAGPIVAAAAAALQGYRRYLGRAVLDPVGMSNLLKSTGSPQTGNLSEPIGPKPNLRAAITAINNELVVWPIQGPNRIVPGEVCHYIESPGGGTPPYTKTWSWGIISGSVAGFPSGDGFTLVGESSNGKAWLKVDVRDAAGATKTTPTDTVTIDALGSNC